MIESKYILSSVDAYYDEKLAEKKYLNDLKESIAEENEEYSDLKYRLRALNIERQKAEFLNNVELIRSLQKEIGELTLKFERVKSKLIADDQNKFDCKICADSGRVGDSHCRCYYKRIINECYAFMGTKNIAAHTFNDDTLSSAFDHGKEFSLVKRYLEKLPLTDKNILITGQKGTGKTFLTECLVNGAADKGLCAIMLSAFTLNNLFAKNVTASVQDKITLNEILCTSDLLVIDDLGAEPIYNKITVENLTAVISERLMNKKPFVITTNLTLNEISLRYGERAFSRICGKQTAIFEMNGKDLRLN